jgi:hypothetical protein
MVMILAGTVVAIGAIFSFWGAQLVQTRLNATANQTSEEVCIGAMFRFYPSSSHYYSEKKELLLILENQRSVDLELKTLYLFYPKKAMQTFDLNEPLQGNILKTITVKNVEDGFSGGTIKTNCAKASLDFTYSDVT